MQGNVDEEDEDALDDEALAPGLLGPPPAI